MRKFLILSVILASCLFFAPSVVEAQDYTQQFNSFVRSSGAPEGAPADPRVVVAQIVGLLFGIIGLMFFIYTVYAGYLILFSAGDEEKIKKGKSTIRTGIIGIFVAMSAYSILTLVSNAVLDATQTPNQPPLDYDVGTQDYTQ